MGASIANVCLEPKRRSVSSAKAAALTPRLIDMRLQDLWRTEPVKSTTHIKLCAVG